MDPADLDRIPEEAIASFADVGHFFHLAQVKPDETLVDLERAKKEARTWFLPTIILNELVRRATLLIL